MADVGVAGGSGQRRTLQIVATLIHSRSLCDVRWCEEAVARVPGTLGCVRKSRLRERLPRLRAVSLTPTPLPLLSPSFSLSAHALLLSAWSSATCVRPRCQKLSEQALRDAGAGEQCCQ
eukprot:3013325-Rhodomonas_salina.5